MKSRVFGFALLSVIAIGAGAPAQAQNGSLTRSFVASTGSDSNPCTVTQPCQTFAQAYTKVSGNGIIAALDPGKYGPLNIVGPVTVDGNGWAAITAPSGGSGITVNAGASNTVTLTGLNVDTGGAYETIGITVNSSGSTVVIDNVRISGGSPAILFQAGQALFLRKIETIGGGGNGIQHNASGGMLTLTDSVLRGDSCFLAQVETPSSPAHATIINSHAEGCYFGFVAGANSIVSISNSSAAGASLNFDICYAGFAVEGDNSGPGALHLDNVVSTSCYYGIVAAPFVGNSGAITIGNSLLTANYYGLSESADGTIYTLGNNRVYGNTMNDNGQPTSAPSSWIQ